METGGDLLLPDTPGQDKTGNCGEKGSHIRNRALGTENFFNVYPLSNYNY